MLIVDSLDLAYEAFQRCRHGARSDRTLDAAHYALDRAVRARRIEVEIPDDVVGFYPLETFRRRRPNASTGLQDMTSEQLYLLSLTREAVASMKETCSRAQDAALIMQIGYALHVLPEVARRGGWKERDFFQFNFRLAAAFWSDLPPPMQSVLCELAGISIESAEVMIEKRGFTLGPVHGRPGEVVSWAQVNIVDYCSDPDAN